MRPIALLPLLLLLPSCATGSSSIKAVGAEPLVKHWGAMREVLREGHTEGRVELAEVIGPYTVAVGALAGLRAEITVVGGTTHLAEVVDPDQAGDGAPGLGDNPVLDDNPILNDNPVRQLRVRQPVAGDEATLLVLADVTTWSEHALPTVLGLAELEASVRAIAALNEIDVTQPFPFRVEGTAGSVRLHVLDRSCPIADPQGPQPWRFAGTREPVVLVGFHAMNADGTLTHHGQNSHTHVVVTERGVSGHLDSIEFLPYARLFLPER